MTTKKIDGGHMLRCTVTGKVTGRKGAIHEGVFLDTSLTTLPASKIASEVAKCWKAAKEDPRMAEKPLTITIRLTPRKV